MKYFFFVFTFLLLNSCLKDDELINVHKVEISYRNFLDIRDSNIYNTVIINGNEWFTENLRYAPPGGKFKTPWLTGDSVSIPDFYKKILGYAYDMKTAYGNDIISNQYFDFDSVLKNIQLRPQYLAPKKYIQGICPNGWHIPSHTEWRELMTMFGDNINNVNINLFVRNPDKTSHFQPINSIGFSIIPKEGFANYERNLLSFYCTSSLIYLNAHYGTWENIEPMNDFAQLYIYYNWCYFDFNDFNNFVCIRCMRNK